MSLDLILASTSPYRRELLQRLGLTFQCERPLVDEEAIQRERPELSPLQLAEALAERKASSLARGGATIIGGDQLVALEGRVLGKPGTPEGAIDQLEMMSGRSHELITALAVWHEGVIHAHTDVATMTMRALSRDEISRYVAADEPWDCAGSYKLERRGIVLFERIECADHSAITGLPLIALTSLLRLLGATLP